MAKTLHDAMSPGKGKEVELLMRSGQDLNEEFPARMNPMPLQAAALEYYENKSMDWKPTVKLLPSNGAVFKQFNV